MSDSLVVYNISEMHDRSGNFHHSQYDVVVFGVTVQ